MVAHPVKKSKGVIFKEITFKETVVIKTAPKIDHATKPIQEIIKWRRKFQLLKKTKLLVSEITAIKFVRKSENLIIIDSSFFKVFPPENDQPVKTLNLNSEGILVITQLDKNVYLLGGSDGTIAVFNASYGLTIQSISAHNNKITSMIFLESYVF